MIIRAKQGDTISSIAREHGLLPETIWDAPENAELKELREDPNILFEGDEVFVREKIRRAESAPSGEKTSFVRKAAVDKLRIRFVDAEDEARSDKEFLVNFHPHQVEGRTDGDGLLEVSIPPRATRATIDLDGERYVVDVGKLDPIDTPSGVQARLSNLGYELGEIDGDVADRTRIALAEFQRAHDLEATGTIDDATTEKLREVHES